MALRRIEIALIFITCFNKEEIPNSICLIVLSKKKIFTEDIFIDSAERRREREKEEHRSKEKQQLGCLLYASQLGIKPAT